MVNGELRMVRRPRAALSPFTASPVAIHHSGRLGGGRTASDVPHTPNTKRPERGAFLWERERPARKSAGTLGGSGKTDDCDGCDAGAMNRAPTGSVQHRMGEIYCALIGYIHGWDVKQGTMDAPHGAFFMGRERCGSGETSQWRRRIRRGRDSSRRRWRFLPVIFPLLETAWRSGWGR